MPQNCTLKMVKMVLILLQKKEKNLIYSDNQRSPEYLRLDSFIHSTHTLTKDLSMGYAGFPPKIHLEQQCNEERPHAKTLKSYHDSSLPLPLLDT